MRPYFLWWSDLTMKQFREALSDPDLAVRAYWLGALLREANSRDVWQFAGPDDIRRLWPLLLRHLGKSRPMWAYILGLPEGPWPPTAAAAGTPRG